MENNDIHKELQGLNSPLAKMEKKNLFEVPLNYFEEMPQSVQSHISQSQKMLPVWRMPKFWLRWSPAFAIVLVFIGIATYMFSPKNVSIQDNVLASQNIENKPVEIAANDILLEEIDEELLVEAYTETVKSEPKKTTIQPATTISDDELEEYILENYDESLLIEEL